MVFFFFPFPFLSPTLLLSLSPFFSSLTEKKFLCNLKLNMFKITKGHFFHFLSIRGRERIFQGISMEWLFMAKDLETIWEVLGIPTSGWRWSQKQAWVFWIVRFTQCNKVTLKVPQSTITEGFMARSVVASTCPQCMLV